MKTSHVIVLLLAAVAVFLAVHTQAADCIEACDAFDDYWDGDLDTAKCEEVCECRVDGDRCSSCCDDDAGCTDWCKDLCQVVACDDDLEPDCDQLCVVLGEHSRECVELCHCGIDNEGCSDCCGDDDDDCNDLCDDICDIVECDDDSASLLFPSALAIAVAVFVVVVSL